MISTTRFGRLYNYKGIYNKVYVVRLDNKKIIRVRNVRFYEKGIPGKSVEEKTLFEVVFNKETEEFTFRVIRFRTTFGSGESPALRIPMTLQFRKTEI